MLREERRDPGEVDKYASILEKNIPKLELNYADHEYVKNFGNNGFSLPFKLADAESFGVRIPKKEGTMYEYLRTIANNIGSDTKVKLIDVFTQGELENYSMGEYVDYLEHRTEENRVLNMISLELSNTIYSKLVLPPEFVRKLDWVEQVLPTEAIETLQFPQVQRYCLAGMANSYTNFHIDLGGTSVWYHVVYGKKRFFVIQPTQENFRKYLNWIDHVGPQSDFFGDIVKDSCYYVDVPAGDTLIIPSGWIHAVFTLEDSVVFGGNFLNSLNIPMQLKCFAIEHYINVGSIYRLPYYKHMHFYLLKSLEYPVSYFIRTSKLATREGQHFPVANIFKPNVFYDLLVLVKSIEVWLKYTPEEMMGLSFSTIQILIRNWWDLLKNIATLDLEHHNLIDEFNRAKSSSLVDYLDLSFVPRTEAFSRLNSFIESVTETQTTSNQNTTSAETEAQKMEPIPWSDMSDLDGSDDDGEGKDKHNVIKDNNKQYCRKSGNNNSSNSTSHDSSFKNGIKNKSNDNASHKKKDRMKENPSRMQFKMRPSKSHMKSAKPTSMYPSSSSSLNSSSSSSSSPSSVAFTTQPPTKKQRQSENKVINKINNKDINKPIQSFSNYVIPVKQTSLLADDDDDDPSLFVATL